MKGLQQLWDNSWGQKGSWRGHRAPICPQHPITTARSPPLPQFLHIHLGLGGSTSPSLARMCRAVEPGCRDPVLGCQPQGPPGCVQEVWEMLGGLGPHPGTRSPLLPPSSHRPLPPPAAQPALRGTVHAFPCHSASEQGNAMQMKANVISPSKQLTCYSPSLSPPCLAEEL